MQAQKAARAQDEEKFKQLYHLAQELQLPPEKVAEMFGGVNTPRKYEPKYRMTDEHGNVHTWSGRGLKTKWILALQNQGKDINDYKVGDDGLTKIERNQQNNQH